MSRLYTYLLVLTKESFVNSCSPYDQELLNILETVETAVEKTISEAKILECLATLEKVLRGPKISKEVNRRYLTSEIQMSEFAEIADYMQNPRNNNRICKTIPELVANTTGLEPRNDVLFSANPEVVIPAVKNNSHGMVFSGAKVFKLNQIVIVPNGSSKKDFSFITTDDVHIVNSTNTTFTTDWKNRRFYVPDLPGFCAEFNVLGGISSSLVTTYHNIRTYPEKKVVFPLYVSNDAIPFKRPQIMDGFKEDVLLEQLEEFDPQFYTMFASQDLILKVIPLYESSQLYIAAELSPPLNQYDWRGEVIDHINFVDMQLSTIFGCKTQPAALAFDPENCQNAEDAIIFLDNAAILCWKLPSHSTLVTGMNMCICIKCSFITNSIVSIYMANVFVACLGYEDRNRKAYAFKTNYYNTLEKIKSCIGCSTGYARNYESLVYLCECIKYCQQTERICCEELEW
jgi:uncharacterized membrane protein